MALTSEQYNQMMREYDARRFQALRDMEIRRETVYGRFPKLRQIQQKIAENAAARARAGILGNTDAVSALDLESTDLRAEKERLIREYRIPEGYLEPHYSCPDCRDTGYIGSEKCHCFRRAISELLYDQSGLRAVLSRENFSALSMEYYDQDLVIGSKNLYDYMQEKIALCKRIAENYETAPESILFYGPTGTGKTFLSNCIAKELLDRCLSVLYFSAIDLFSLFSRNRYGQDPDPVERSVLECDLLIIDDLGTESVNSFTVSKLFYCINERLNRRKGTVISTNLDPAHLRELYSERIYSRIVSGYTLLRLDGQDIRIRKKFNSK